MPADGSHLIELRGISRVYGHGHALVRALSDVDLVVDAGEFVAIMGPSGSGKSTVMNIIGCLDTPTSGEYRFEGVEVGHLPRNQRALVRRHLLGFVFQGFNLLARTTALENVELPLLYRGMPSHERRAMAMRALARVGLTGRETHTPSELSGGQQQRVAIARAIVTDPVVLLADEPTGNLDTGTSREIMELVTGLNRDQGITVIMVTHESEIAAYARRVVRFVDGRISSDFRQRRGGLMLYDAFKLALAAIFRNALRSFLTLLGIVIGVGAVIAMVTIGNGTTAKVTADLAKLGSNLLFVSPGQFGPGRASSDARPFNSRDIEAMKGQLTGVKAVAPVAQKSATVVYGAENRITVVTGTDNDYFVTQDWILAAGRQFFDSELRGGRAACIIGRRCGRSCSAPVTR